MQDYDTFVEPEFDRPEDDGFKITNDAQAGWAMRKIKAIRADCDRFVGQCQERKAAYCREMDALIDSKFRSAERDKSYLIDMLRDYADQQDEDAFDVSKKTGVRSYRLPEGKLVYKPATSTLTHNPDVLLASLKAKGLTDYIKVSEAPKWADVKNALFCTWTNGAAAALLTPDGECIEIEGISETMVPGRFEVEVK